MIFFYLTNIIIWFHSQIYCCW